LSEEQAPPVVPSSLQPAPPPPPPSAAAPWPPPPPPPVPQARATTRQTRSPFATRYLVALAAGLVAVGIAMVVILQMRANRALVPGDCVALTSSAVHRVACSSAHDGQVSAVLHRPYETCPVGSDEYDLADNSANLCIDRLLSSH
jgi:hypothetical protein